MPTGRGGDVAAEQAQRSDDSAHRARFVLDGQVVELAGSDPTRTVLEVLREDLQRTGTKEGCAEGDCGACTVVLGELDANGTGLEQRAVNACIQLAATLDGKQLVTVESLAGRGGALHPAQRAMVEQHGSQCGFCTPGIVMSLYALHRTDPRPSRRSVEEALAGNLCRCTGYRSIVAAAQAMAGYEAPAEPAAGSDEATIALLRGLRRERALCIDNDAGRYFAPRRLDELADILVREPQACVLAGGTDVGLWVTKHHRELPTIVYLGDVAELREVHSAASHLEIGAGVSLTRAAAAIEAHYPELAELFVRFASPPIRNAGTLGGNIANGSPIGDSMPALIALDAQLCLRRGDVTRELPLDAFYLGYQKTALAPGELITRIRIPLPHERPVLRSYKVSKRFDQDISAVCGAFCMQLADGHVSRIRIAYGGLAATVARASRCEQALLGGLWNEASVRAAMDALDGDFSPIGDMRASATYRSTVARNLLYRFYLESRAATPLPGIYRDGRSSHG